MRKINIIIALLALTLLSPVYGQGFLKKIGKGLDKINKELEKVDKELKGGSKTSGLKESANLTDNEAYNEVLVKSFSPQIDIVLESCIRDGNKVIIKYFLINKGEALTISNLGTRKTVLNPDDETLFIGSDGKNYKSVYYELGSVNSDTPSRLMIPAGVRLSGSFEIADVSTSVNQFSLVNIAGLIRNNDDSKPFSFSFRNVPIYYLNETLAMMNPTELRIIENPPIKSITLENTGIASILITDKYTRVDCYWKNTQFNPRGSIFLTDTGSAWIEIEGKKYMLKQYAGIGSRKDDVWVNYNQTANYTYIFEPIPAGTDSFNLYGGDESINFMGVNIRQN